MISLLSRLRLRFSLRHIACVARVTARCSPINRQHASCSPADSSLARKTPRWQCLEAGQSTHRMQSHTLAPRVFLRAELGYHLSLYNSRTDAVHADIFRRMVQCIALVMALQRFRRRIRYRLRDLPGSAPNQYSQLIRLRHHAYAAAPRASPATIHAHDVKSLIKVFFTE